MPLRMDKFEQFLIALGTTKGTLTTYKRILSSIDKKFPSNYLESLKDDSVSNSTRQGRFAVLRRYYQAIDDEESLVALQKPLIKAGLNRKGTAIPRAGKPLDEDSYSKFVDVLENYRGEDPQWVWPVLSLMLTLGLRAKVDICNLQRKALIQAVKTGRLGLWTKGNKIREVPIDPVREELAIIIREMANFDTIGGWIAPNANDAEEGAYRAIVRQIKEMAVLAGLDPSELHTHVFRHTCAQRLYEKSGHDIQLVQQLLGHSSIVTTQRYLKADRLNDAAVLLKKAIMNDVAMAEGGMLDALMERELEMLEDEDEESE